MLKPKTLVMLATLSAAACTTAEDSVDDLVFDASTGTGNDAATSTFEAGAVVADAATLVDTSVALPDTSVRVPAPAATPARVMPGPATQA